MDWAHGILFDVRESGVCPGDWVITSPSGKRSFVVQADYFEAVFLGNEKVGNAGLDKAEASIQGTGIKSAYGLETDRLIESQGNAAAWRKIANGHRDDADRYCRILIDICRMFPEGGDFNSLPALVKAELNLRESNEAEIKRLNAEIQRWSKELVKSEGECAELKQRLGCSQKENTALRQRLDKREDTLKELTEACNEMDSKISKLEARQNADRGFEQLSEANQRVVDALEESAEIRSDELTHEYMLRASEVSIIEMRRMRRGVEQIVQWLAQK
jgi:hypothetical protein